MRIARQVVTEAETLTKTSKSYLFWSVSRPVSHVTTTGRNIRSGASGRAQDTRNADIDMQGAPGARGALRSVVGGCRMRRDHPPKSIKAACGVMLVRIGRVCKCRVVERRWLG